MNLKVRFARAGDIDALLGIEKEAHREIRWWKIQTRQEFRHSLDLSKHNIIVAEEDGRILGYVQAELNLRGYGRYRKVFLENIYVLRGYRRKGVARLLVRKFAGHWCSGKRHIAMITPPKSMKIFERLGFRWPMAYMEL